MAATIAVAVFAVADAEGNRKKISGSSGFQPPPRLPVPAGRYYVTGTSSAAQGAAEVTVVEGGVHKVRLVLNPK